MKKSFKYLAAILLFMIAAAGYYLYKAAPVASGYTSKYLCSFAFNSGQDPDEAMELFIKPVNGLFDFVHYHVDRSQKTVTASLFGFLRPATSVFRDGCGCTLIIDKDVETLRQQTRGLTLEPPALPDTTWPAGNRVEAAQIPVHIDLQKLKTRINREFTETTEDPAERINTLAIAVAYKDQIIAEQYRPGITDRTPLLSWSASKSVTNALIGRWVQLKGLDIYQPTGFQEWANDERKMITIDQLLRMESGLHFDERYAPMAEAVEMLYETPDMAAYARDKPLEAAPGTQWSYSSGTTNILAHYLLDLTGGDIQSLETFAHRELFDKLGMTSAIFEHDESGSFVGSSYFFASARDWLRFCLLFKNNGVWNGEQLLPAGWVDYSLKPTPHAPSGKYGAQIWLNAGGEEPGDRLLPRLPEDTYAFEGYQGQWFVVIPSRELMIARFGVTNTKNWQVEDLIADLLEILDQP